MNIISRGAEAVIYEEDGDVIKDRISKGYRIKEIDEKLRRLRTKSEARLLERARGANVPMLYGYSDRDMRIRMEYIHGVIVREVFDNLNITNLKKLCNKIGRQIGKLHKVDVVQGDLTTSNMLLRENELYIIDFGLGFVSNKIEDKAVDLRLLRQALGAQHYNVAANAFKYILESYGKEYKESKAVLKRLKEKVEKRGRYKRKNKL